VGWLGEGWESTNSSGRVSGVCPTAGGQRFATLRRKMIHERIKWANPKRPSQRNIPVRYVGVSEQMTDLLEFDRAAFVDSLPG
jgi:hypothetical protein